MIANFCKAIPLLSTQCKQQRNVERNYRVLFLYNLDSLAVSHANNIEALLHGLYATTVQCVMNSLLIRRLVDSLDAIRICNGDRSLGSVDNMLLFVVGMVSEYSASFCSPAFITSSFGALLELLTYELTSATSLNIQPVTDDLPYLPPFPKMARSSGNSEAEYW